MDWLKPQEVRDWLVKYPIRTVQDGQVRYSATNREHAWEQFGLAVADAEIEYMPYGRLPPSVREVARLIRDAQEGK